MPQRRTGKVSEASEKELRFLGEMAGVIGRLGDEELARGIRNPEISRRIRGFLGKSGASSVERMMIEDLEREDEKEPVWELVRGICSREGQKRQMERAILRETQVYQRDDQAFFGFLGEDEAAVTRGFEQVTSYNDGKNKVHLLNTTFRSGSRVSLARLYALSQGMSLKEVLSDEPAALEEKRRMGTELIEKIRFLGPEEYERERGGQGDYTAYYEGKKREMFSLFEDLYRGLARQPLHFPESRKPEALAESYQELMFIATASQDLQQCFSREVESVAPKEFGEKAGIARTIGEMKYMGEYCEFLTSDLYVMPDPRRTGEAGDLAKAIAAKENMERFLQDTRKCTTCEQIGEKIDRDWGVAALALKSDLGQVLIENPGMFGQSADYLFTGEGPVCFYDPRTKQYQVGPAREIEKRSLEAARETGKYRISPDRERELKEGMEVISLSELEEAGREKEREEFDKLEAYFEKQAKHRGNSAYFRDVTGALERLRQCRKAPASKESAMELVEAGKELKKACDQYLAERKGAVTFWGRERLRMVEQLNRFVEQQNFDQVRDMRVVKSYEGKTWEQVGRIPLAEITLKGPSETVGANLSQRLKVEYGGKTGFFTEKKEIQNTNYYVNKLIDSQEDPGKKQLLSNNRAWISEYVGLMDLFQRNPDTASFHLWRGTMLEAWNKNHLEREAGRTEQGREILEMTDWDRLTHKIMSEYYRRSDEQGNFAGADRKNQEFLKVLEDLKVPQKEQQILVRNQEFLLGLKRPDENVTDREYEFLRARYEILLNKWKLCQRLDGMKETGGEEKRQSLENKIRFVDVLLEDKKLGRQVFETTKAVGTASISDSVGRFGGDGSGVNELTSRNIASSRIAELLGIGGILAHSEKMVVRSGDRQVAGCFMELAQGMDARSGDYVSQRGLNQVELVPSRTEGGPDRFYQTGSFLRDMTTLEVLDYLCAQNDRHSGNMLYRLSPADENGKRQIIGLQGIDNDLSFGSRDDVTSRFHKGLENMTFIDHELAEKVRALDERTIRFALEDLLPQNHISAAVKRVTNLQQHLKENMVELDSPEKWELEQVDLSAYPKERDGELEPEMKKYVEGVRKIQDAVAGSEIFIHPSGMINEELETVRETFGERERAEEDLFEGLRGIFDFQEATVEKAALTPEPERERDSHHERSFHGERSSLPERNSHREKISLSEIDPHGRRSSLPEKSSRHEQDSHKEKEPLTLNGKKHGGRVLSLMLLVLASFTFTFLYSGKTLTAYAASGWQQQDGAWYFHNPDGSVQTGWIMDKGKSYYLYPDGRCAMDTVTPDGYYVDGSGAWWQRKSSVLGVEIVAPKGFLGPEDPVELGMWSGEASLILMRRALESAFGGKRTLRIQEQSVEYIDKETKEPIITLSRNRETGEYRLDLTMELDPESRELSRAATYDYQVFQAFLYQFDSAPEILEQAIVSAWNGQNHWNINRQSQVAVADCQVRYTAGTGYGTFWLKERHPDIITDRPESGGWTDES